MSIIFKTKSSIKSFLRLNIGVIMFVWPLLWNHYLPPWDRLYLVSYTWYASAWAFKMLWAVIYVFVPEPCFPGGNAPKP